MDNLRTGRGRADIDIRPQTGLALIRCANGPLELRSIRGFDEVNGASAKPAAGHACSVKSPLAGSNLDHEIEFRTAYFIVVAEAAVGIYHQLSKVAALSSLQSLSHLVYPRILGDHMASTPVTDIR